MITYFDTSALIKKYLEEKDSSSVCDVWDRSEYHAVSVVGYAEMMAVLQRKKKAVSQKISEKRLVEVAIKRFRNDWESLVRVECIEDLRQRIDTVTSRHQLRGFDAIHLASALYLEEAIGSEFQFICSDKKLLDAAEKEHLLTIGCG